MLKIIEMEKYIDDTLLNSIFREREEEYEKFYKAGFCDGMRIILENLKTNNSK